MTINTSAPSNRATVMTLIKTAFASTTPALWDRIESEVAVMCAGLPEILSDERKPEFIAGVRAIKAYLGDEGIPPSDLTFIDDYISLHENTTQMSLYEESDDWVEKDVIDKYAGMSTGTEGIIGIHLPYNYTQLRKLTNGVYNRTGLIKFYISREKTMSGKVIAEIYDYPQKIPIATLFHSKKLSEIGEPLIKQIALFGDKIDKSKYVEIKQIKLPFRVYRFISDDKEDYILMTPNELSIGDYVVTGMAKEVDDAKVLTDTAKLPTKLPFFFAQSIKNRIIRFADHDQFRARLVQLGVSKGRIYDFPFCIKKKGANYVLRHPDWFKKLVWAWLLHTRIGLFNTYPLHILWVGPKGSGKSLMLNALHNKSKESRDIFSGSSSTMKNLVPSFKYAPARLGYLAESNRFAFCDEFLRCIVNTRTTNDGAAREESVAIMNDLLEHQKREAGSGVSRINVNMTARILATTNPIRGMHSMDDVVNTLDESFLSRWLVYYQSENDEHVKMIRASNDAELKRLEFDMDDNDWVSILDYMQSFKSTYDLKRIEGIHAEVVPVLSNNLQRHYDARHKHHIEALMDGLVKLRCLLELDMKFEAKDEDYEQLRLVWNAVIRSWIDGERVKALPLDKRIFYLPENVQALYWGLCEKKKPCTRIETEEIATAKDLSKREYTVAYIILRENGLIVENDGMVAPHYHYSSKVVFDAKA